MARGVVLVALVALVSAVVLLSATLQLAPAELSFVPSEKAISPLGLPMEEELELAGEDDDGAEEMEMEEEEKEKEKEDSSREELEKPWLSEKWKEEVAAKTLDSAKPLRVVVYNGPGTSERSWKNVLAVMKCPSMRRAIVASTIGDLTEVNRTAFDVVVVPGGVASKLRKHYWRMGDDVSLKTIFQTFIKSGGGYVGICGGAYLAKFLDLNPFTTRTSGHASGYFVHSKWLDSAGEQAVLVDNQQLMKDKVFYAYGPFYSKPRPGGKKGFFHNFQVLLETETSGRLYSVKTPNGVGSRTSSRYSSLPLIVSSDYALGRIVLSTGHPETNVSSSTSSRLNISGPAQCGSSLASVLQNMILYSFHIVSISS